MDYSNYILDLERLNELSTHPNDGKKETPFESSVIYSLSRGFLKMALKKYEAQFSKHYMSCEEDEKIFKTLHYNKVILAPCEIRDEKITEILN